MRKLPILNPNGCLRHSVPKYKMVDNNAKEENDSIRRILRKPVIVRSEWSGVWFIRNSLEKNSIMRTRPKL